MIRRYHRRGPGWWKRLLSRFRSRTQGRIENGVSLLFFIVAVVVIVYTMRH